MSMQSSTYGSCANLCVSVCVCVYVCVCEVIITVCVGERRKEQCSFYNNNK